jgi:hypothetical protein
VKVDQDGTTSVYVPSGHGAPGRFLPFPDPLLAPVSSEADRLAVVLMSMVLAFADLTTSGSLDAIAPYERLRALGTSGRGGLESYDSPNEELSAWVLNGEIPPTAPTPPEHLAGSKSDEVSSRREAIVARLDAWTNSYQRVFSTVDQRADVFDVQPAWELRDDISNALEVVSEQVRHVRPTVDEF